MRRKALHESRAAGLQRRAAVENAEIVVDAVDGRGFEPHLGPIRVQFLGQQHGHAGMGALPHLRLRHDDGYPAGTVDFDPAVEGLLGTGGWQGAAWVHALPLR